MVRQREGKQWAERDVYGGGDVWIAGCVELNDFSS
jgi:hypothetical protein